MDDEQDTDTSLALLASLLEPAEYPLEQLIDALTEAGGNVQAAAEQLLLPRVKSAGKRKAGTSLDSWLGKRRTSSSATLVQVEPAPATPPKTASSTVDLLSVLKQAETGKPRTAPQSALLLTSQEAIDKHSLPLSILQSPLSPSFASALYFAMMKESETWDRNRWYLAGRWVESPHLMTMYTKDGGGFENEKGESQYYYAGSKIKHPLAFPALLRQAAEMIEPVVNEAINKRKRYPGEYAGPWQANMCAANRYDGANSSVGFHADQLTYLGPFTTIASLSLGTPRAFRLRRVETVDESFSSGNPIRTYEVSLGHNSLVLMNAGCQERYKHTVPSQKALDVFKPGWDVHENPIRPADQKTYTSRINITFRFYRPDFDPTPGPDGRQGTPICKCGMPTLLRADQKAKTRSRLPPSPIKKNAPDRQDVTADDMVFFWQCQSPNHTGDLKGCGFFQVLDMRAEGRGPCIGD